MPSIFTDYFTKLRTLWSRTNVTQRVFIAGLAAAVIIAFLVMVLWLNRPDYAVLYSNLYPEDASKIVESLKSEKVPYKLTNNGTTIMVPEQAVYDQRLKIAGEGALVGQGVGFEIFDEIKVGQTDFVQKINYQRALQGELARTITDFPAVERARVHLVIPNRSLFIEEQHDPSSSVVLKLADGKSLKNKEVEAIVNLVVMSVEGMKRDRITVADTSGKILYSPSDDATLEGMTTSQLEYKLTLQQNLERRIEEMLFPVIGPGKVIAKVNADLDFSQRTIRKEEYDPEVTVVRSEQRSEESTQGRANTEAGIPEANFRGDGIAGALSQQQSTRETRTTNFEINKTEQQIIAPMGEVDRLSVAVIVDGTYEKDAETEELVFTPRQEEELTRIRSLVENAVGYSSARGDSIEVSTIAFGTADIEPYRTLADTIMYYAMRIGKPVLQAFLILLFMLLVVRPVILALIRPRVEGEAVEGLEGLPEGQERLALVEGDEEEAEALDSLRKIDDIKAHATQLSEQNLDQAVAILRHWLKEPEGVKVG
jgi:flagellar M-ring protein FliF